MPADVSRFDPDLQVCSRLLKVWNIQRKLLSFLVNLYRIYKNTCEYKEHLRGRIGFECPDYTPDYFRELLLTYKLLFGQDTRSWNAFTNKVKSNAWGPHWNCSDSTPDGCHSSYDDSDPLLLTLCTSHPLPLYKAFESPDSPDDYPSHDFPFFGVRLLTLQTYVKDRNPRNLWALWQDRRNLALWMNYWPVIIIAALTVVFSFVQMVVQIWGTVLQQVQASQGGGGGLGGGGG